MFRKLLGLLRKRAPGAGVPAPGEPAASPPRASGYVDPQPRPPFPDAGASARVVLYVEGWCSHSQQAERLCVARAWPTRREDLSGRHAEKVALFAEHRWRTLPMVFVDGRFLGGLRELVALEALP